jgi:hypothetical protein
MAPDEGRFIGLPSGKSLGSHSARPETRPHRLATVAREAPAFAAILFQWNFARFGHRRGIRKATTH